MKWADMGEANSPYRVAVVGAGLAGLAAAHRLHELARERNEPVEVTLFESGSRLGGLVGTERIGDYLVDIGADSFLTNKPAAVNLCQRLGIEDQLIATDTRYRGAFVLHQGRPIPIPEGFQLLCPTAIWPVITSPLFSVWGKFRLLLERLVPRKKPTSIATVTGGNPPDSEKIQSDPSPILVDESLSDFVIRRFGKEAFDRLIQPLVGGIYTADPRRLSLAATMPRFLEMERDYGSLIRASRLQKSARHPRTADTSSEHSDSSSDSSSGARYGLFAGLKGGMNDLVEALRQHANQSYSVQLNRRVVSIDDIHQESEQRPDTATPRSFALTFADGTQEQFAAVIVAVTAARAAPIVASIDAKLSDELRAIEFASSAIVVSGHRLSDITHPLNAFGLVIPHTEGRDILAVSFSSRKFPDRAPVGHVLLRTFVGGALQPEILKSTDDELIQIVRKELGSTLGVQGEPDFVRVYRYQEAMPQYHVGHLDRVSRIETLVGQHPHFALAGIACRGVGIPDAIASGEHAADSILKIWD